MNSKLLSTGAAVLLALAIGCSRNIDSPTDPDLKIDSPPVPASLTASIGDREVRLDWTVTAPAQVSTYLIYRSDTTAANFKLLDSVTAIGYTDRSVVNGQNYFYKVSARNLRGVEGNASSAVLASPGLFAIRINADSAYTSRRDVRLSLTASGVSLMQLANDTTQPGGWEEFRDTRNWTLEAGPGVKTVFARFRTASGLESATWARDQITYDDRAEIRSVTVSDSVLQPADSLVIFADCGEPDGVATCSLSVRRNVPLYDDGSGVDATAGDGVYSGVYVATPDDVFEQKRLYARFTDRAGNQATALAAPWYISVRRPPSAPVWISIQPEVDDPTALNLTWSMESVSPFGHFNIRRSQISGEGLAAPIIKQLTSASATSYKDTGLTALTRYYYTIEVVLTNGLSALSPEDSGLTAADLPPDSVTLLPPNELKFNRVGLAWTQSTVSDFSAYQLRRSLTPSVTETSPLLMGSTTRTSTSFTDTTVTGSSVYYYRVYVIDAAGQSTGSNILTVNTPADLPPASVTLAQSATQDSTVKLVWNQSQEEDFASYRVFRASTSSPLTGIPNDSLLVNIITDRTTTVHEETGLKQVYYYRVFVYDRSGLYAGSNIVSGP